MPSKKKKAVKTEVSSQKPEVSTPPADLRPPTSECQAEHVGYHACTCGGNLCGANVTE